MRAGARSDRIRSIPTLMIFRERVMLFSQPGALPGSALEQVLAQAQALDLDQVRREIAAQPRDTPPETPG